MSAGEICKGCGKQHKCFVCSLAKTTASPSDRQFCGVIAFMLLTTDPRAQLCEEHIRVIADLLVGSIAAKAAAEATTPSPTPRGEPS